MYLALQDYEKLNIGKTIFKTDIKLKTYTNQQESHTLNAIVKKKNFMGNFTS